MNTHHHRKRGTALLASAALGAAGLVAVSAGPAGADGFEQGNSIPTISVANTVMSITPTATGSDVQTLIVDMADYDGFADIADMTLCLTSTTAGVTDCTSPANQNAFTLAFDEDTNTFTTSMTDSGSIKPYSATEDDSDHSYVTKAGNDIQINLRFQTSKVAKEGGWELRSATVTDAQAAEGSDATPETVTGTVSWYGGVTSQRTSVDFGIIAQGETSVTNAEDKSVGTIFANGGSDIQMDLAANFVDGSAHSITTAGNNPTDAPSVGEVALDCKAGATYNNTGAVRLAVSSPLDINTAVLSDGTAEAGVTSVKNSCRLSNGGTEQASGTAFTATVAVGITADS